MNGERLSHSTHEREVKARSSHSTLKRSHHTQRVEEKSSRSMRGRGIIVLNTRKIVIMLSAWKIIIVPVARNRKDDRGSLGNLHRAKIPQKSDWTPVLIKEDISMHETQRRCEIGRKKEGEKGTNRK